MINRKNYELYFMDFADGKLSPTQKASLYAFLNANPDLKEEFELFTNVEVNLDAENIAFDRKSSLKKNDYSEKLIALIEGDLSGAEKVELENLISSDKFIAKEFSSFKKTISTPDEKIIFSRKSQLKRGGKVLAFSSYSFRRSLSIAASLLLIAIAYFLLKEINSPKNLTADKKEIETKIPAHHQPLKTEQQVATVIEPKAEKKAERVNAYHAVLPENKKQEEHLNIEKLSPSNYEVNESPLAMELKEIPSTGISNPDSVKEVTASTDPVFTPEELAEFRNMSNKNNSNSLPDKGLSELSKLTDITVKKTEDDSQNKTFALAVGKFSFKRTTR